VHDGYAGVDADGSVLDAADDLAALVAAAHTRGIAVWIDVVYNHTAEEDVEVGVTTSWRGIADEHAYRRIEGRVTNDSGCGNDTNVAHPEMQRVILESLDRYAALGVDGFRFDLASLLTRDGGGLVRQIGDWGEARGVRLIAEAWDLGAYQVGDAFPDRRWAQWNDRFREDVRGFLRAEPGLVPALEQRVAGSRDLFPGEGTRTVNFIDAHDGLTLHDLTIVTDDHHRSWDCGPELRMQQLKNAFCHLLLSEGTVMFVMGDEFARTQGGDPNPYRTDSPVTWVDWGRADEWRELTEFVRALIDLRHRHPVTAPRFHGVAGGDGDVDRSWHSRSLAWSTDHLIVLANTWWEPLELRVPRPGSWQIALATATPHAVDVVDLAEGGLATVTLAPRSRVVLTR
jgi:glycogen operon protein